jgi:CheY-like chemotaxis protein
MKPEEAPEILLVEDEAVDIELTLRAFAKACVRNRVHVARDGAEALNFVFCTGSYAHRKFDSPAQVVLLDLKLPKVPGLDVLRRMKADARTRNIPVVVLSSSDRDRDIEESRRLGAETYIVKPVNFESFSAITPQLRLCWALEKTPEGELAGAAKTRM